jgi:hypothetical protein
MGIHFNGQVTINGNVEMYENGSMKITANQLNVSISDLPKFIEENLRYSPNKIDYLEAAETLQSSNDPSKIKSALTKLGEMAKELGKNVMFTGLSQMIIDVIKGVLG